MDPADACGVDGDRDLAVHKDIQRLLDIDVSDSVVRSPDRPEGSFAERARDYGAWLERQLGAALLPAQ